MKLAPLISSGFHFRCTLCGNCCSSSQEGYVFVYWSDITKMSHKLHLTLVEFAENFLLITPYDYKIWDENLEDTHKTRSLDTLVLNYHQTQDCMFLNEKNECDLYSDRPLQCKLFPFWNMIMTSDLLFQSILKDCKGDFSKSEGNTFYSPDQIKNLIRQERQVEFDYFQEMKKHDFDIFQIYPFLEQTQHLNSKRPKSVSPAP